MNDETGTRLKVRYRWRTRAVKIIRTNLEQRHHFLLLSVRRNLNGTAQRSQFCWSWSKQSSDTSKRRLLNKWPALQEAPFSVPFFTANSEGNSRQFCSGWSKQRSYNSKRRDSWANGQRCMNQNTHWSKWLTLQESKYSLEQMANVARYTLEQRATVAWCWSEV